MPIKKKTDEEFFDSRIGFFIENGKKLMKTAPEIIDEYNDHSLLKLIAIMYWIGIFSPIAHKQLKQKYGYEVVYVDTMAGSGVTRTKREGDSLCGSCAGAILSAQSTGYPFDKIIAVEVNKEKAETLRARILELDSGIIPIIYDEDLNDISNSIVKNISNNTI